MRRKRRRLSPNTIGKAVAVATLAGSLWQGWQAGRQAGAAQREAEGAHGAARAVAALATSGAEADVALADRVALLEREVRRLKRLRPAPPDVVYGPEEAPAWYKPPESRGLLWHLKNLGRKG